MAINKNIYKKIDRNYYVRDFYRVNDNIKSRFSRLSIKIAFIIILKHISFGENE